MRHAVAKSISRITTPMFLGLDRRLEYVHSDPNVPAGASVEMERRELLLWRHRGLVDERTTFASTNATGLAEIQVLVQETLLSVRAAQDELDRALRAEMLVDALKYVPTAPSMERPNRKALDAYKARKAQIETATTRLALPPEEVQNALTSFFDKMDEVVGRLEHPAAGAADRSKGKKNARSQAEAKEYSRNVEWMLNKSQADRIFGHLERLTVYERRHDDLQEPIDRYLKLANGFLEQTKKQIVIDDTGRLSVSFGEGKRQAISALSSGERQIVVMLAHLSLNKQLQTSGVFIVDEPELSLHVSWQEMFVDAIREANPNVQLIMATHSPAIILDRDAACVSLS